MSGEPLPSHPDISSDGRRRFSPRDHALVAATVVLAYLAAATIAPYVTAIVLGSWIAHLARPLYVRLERVLRGRGKAASLLTVVLVLLVLSPVVLAVLTLLPTARSLVDQVRSAGSGSGALEALVSGGDGHSPTPITAQSIIELVKRYGENASRVLGAVAGASVAAVVAVFVFAVVFFAALEGGARLDRWVEAHAPVDPGVYRRLRSAYFQAGRGLLVGNGVTALVQGGIATVTYFALGVPRALLLGLLSTVAALVPMTGPTLVWLPVTAGLALTGHTVKAIILAAVGLGVVGTIDNLLRPWIARRAQFGLDTSVLIVSIFGGMVAFGGWGLLLGPLVVRLAVEALALVRERGLFRDASSSTGEDPAETPAWRTSSREPPRET